MSKRPAAKARKDSALLIGVARVDITPPVGATLVGYKPRTSDGLGHRLRAEAIVCRGPDGAWAFVTSDTIGFRRSYVQLIRRKIAKVVGLQPEAILISGTHTHSGPATIQFDDANIAAFDAIYLDQLAERLAAVVIEAWKAAEPGIFETAWGEAPTLGSNRRVQLQDGTWTNEWQDEFGQHPGYFDPTALLIGVRRPDGRRPALVVNYGVHPVTLGPSSLKISADYCGYLKDTLEARGAAETVMFALAGGGNINPRICIKTGFEFPRRMGEALAETVLAAAGKLYPVAVGPVAAHLEPWSIVRTRDAFKGANQDKLKTGSTVATEIQALRAGDLVLVSLPGELFSEYSRMLREASPLPHTAVVSLANDYVGYLPTDWAQTEGAYETNMAPAVGLQASLMAHAKKALAAVAK